MNSTEALPYEADEIDLRPANLSAQKNVIRIFYKEMWDKANLDLIPEIFHPDFTFRGSLGPVLVGHDEFAEYVKWVTGSIENYTSSIFDLVEEGCMVSGKLIFHGTQRKELFGSPATGEHVWWYGAPIFTFEDGKVRDLWVLGDVHGLLTRAGQRQEAAEFSL